MVEGGIERSPITLWLCSVKLQQEPVYLVYLNYLRELLELNYLLVYIMQLLPLLSIIC
jgi:hypothetical protein